MFFVFNLFMDVTITHHLFTTQDGRVLRTQYSNVPGLSSHDLDVELKAAENFGFNSLQKRTQAVQCQKKTLYLFGNSNNYFICVLIV